MSKVTINKNDDGRPSAEVVRSATKSFRVNDELGRTLTLKMPTFQDQIKYDLYFGKYEEENKKFYMSNQYILFLKEIDEVPIAFPTNEAEILALAGRLGNEGIAAVMQGIDEYAENVAAPLKDAEEKATLKK